MHINTQFWMHRYYTPKFTKFQAFLAKMAFFVNYDGLLCQYHYVNIIR